MHTGPCKVSDKPSGRKADVQLLLADTVEDMLILSGVTSHGDEKRAERNAVALFNGYRRVKFQADNREDLAEAEDLPKAIETLQEIASTSPEDGGWFYEAGRERKPKAPKEVAVAEKESYSKDELDAILAQVGAKRAVATE